MQNGQAKIVTGIALVPDLSEEPEGKLIVAYDNKTEGLEPNYQILATDYDHFAIVWNCVELNNGKSEGGWEFPIEV